MELYNYVFRYTVKGAKSEFNRTYTKKNDYSIPIERVMDEIRELYWSVDELHDATIDCVKIIKV